MLFNSDVYTLFILPNFDDIAVLKFYRCAVWTATEFNDGNQSNNNFFDILEWHDGQFTDISFEWFYIVGAACLCLVDSSTYNHHSYSWCLLDFHLFLFLQSKNFLAKVTSHFWSYMFSSLKYTCIKWHTIGCKNTVIIIMIIFSLSVSYCPLQAWNCGVNVFFWTACTAWYRTMMWVLISSSYAAWGFSQGRLSCLR